MRLTGTGAARGRLEGTLGLIKMCERAHTGPEY